MFEEFFQCYLSLQLTRFYICVENTGSVSEMTIHSDRYIKQVYNSFYTMPAREK